VIHPCIGFFLFEHCAGVRAVASSLGGGFALAAAGTGLHTSGLPRGTFIEPRAAQQQSSVQGRRV
jgi:hypothetical protein